MRIFRTDRLPATPAHKVHNLKLVPRPDGRAGPGIAADDRPVVLQSDAVALEFESGEEICNGGRGGQGGELALLAVNDELHDLNVNQADEPPGTELPKEDAPNLPRACRDSNQERIEKHGIHQPAVRASARLTSLLMLVRIPGFGSHASVFFSECLSGHWREIPSYGHAIGKVRDGL